MIKLNSLESLGLDSNAEGVSTQESKRTITTPERRMVATIILKAIDDLRGSDKNAQSAFQYLTGTEFHSHCDFFGIDADILIPQKFIHSPDFIRHFFMNKRNIISHGSKTFDNAARIFSSDLKSLNEIVFKDNHSASLALIKFADDLSEEYGIHPEELIDDPEEESMDDGNEYTPVFIDEDSIDDDASEILTH